MTIRSFLISILRSATGTWASHDAASRPRDEATSCASSSRLFAVMKVSLSRNTDARSRLTNISPPRARLARRRRISSPNPTSERSSSIPADNVVGTGFYTYDGVKHAEVLALEQAGEKARGGTLYINLEPHCHQGRTPPCTDALIAAGIRRVVACMPDPNPKVSGRGFEQLRASGIAVEVGRFEAEARRLNESFARYIRHGIPLVTLKSAMTLDGKIAPPPAAESDRKAGIPPGGWITGEAARAHVQRTASPERCDPGRRWNDPGGRSIAHGSQRTSATASAACA